MRRELGIARCGLEKNESNGVVYHREGINGDYDDFKDAEELISFIKTGKKTF